MQNTLRECGDCSLTLFGRLWTTLDSPNQKGTQSGFSSIARSDISVILVQNWHHGVSESANKKIASTGYWTHNTNPTLRFPAPLTTQPPRLLLNRRFMNWTLIISGLIEHDFKRVWKFEAGMDWQIGWVGKGAGILIVGLVLWVKYPVEAIFFADFLIPWCQFCTRMTEMSDLAIEEKLEWMCCNKFCEKGIRILSLW